MSATDSNTATDLAAYIRERTRNGMDLAVGLAKMAADAEWVAKHGSGATRREAERNAHAAKALLERLVPIGAVAAALDEVEAELERRGDRCGD